MPTPAVALQGPLPIEVDFAATVTSPPTAFASRRTGRHHEAFLVRAADGTAVRIVDNIDLAPRCPIVPGDRIEVRGELVADPGHLPIVHWTHHDPAHRHADGYLEWNGHRYA